MPLSIPRLLEQHAAATGDAVALLSGPQTLTYRGLNLRANAVARRLLAHGFRRGGRVHVCRSRSVDLAVVLLGVLKAGGAYLWIDPDRTATWPQGVYIATGQNGSEDQYLAVDLGDVLSQTTPTPNLPIMTRDSDIACVLADEDGAPAVLVPHSTVVSLGMRVTPETAAWTGEPGAMDLWAGLVAGATLAVHGEPVAAAA